MYLDLSGGAGGLFDLVDADVAASVEANGSHCDLSGCGEQEVEVSSEYAHLIRRGSRGREVEGEEDYR